MRDKLIKLLIGVVVTGGIYVIGERVAVSVAEYREYQAEQKAVYTWYVMDQSTPMIYEIESAPKFKGSTIEFDWNGNQIVICNNWSAYKMKHK